MKVLLIILKSVLKKKNENNFAGLSWPSLCCGKQWNLPQVLLPVIRVFIGAAAERLTIYYLGNKYSSKIWKDPFMVCKSTKHVWPWVLVFSIVFLNLNYCIYPSGHRFVKEIEVILGPALLTIYSVLQSFSKSTFWLHLITASKLLELEHCGCTQIKDLEK